MKNKQVFFMLVGMIFAVFITVVSCKKDQNFTYVSISNSYLKADTSIVGTDTLFVNGDTIVYGGDTTILLDSVIISYRCYVDGTEVSLSSFPAEDFANYRYHGHQINDKDNNPYTVTVRALAFSDVNDYYSYTNALGFDFELLDQVTSHLSDYAETNGHIDEFEQTGNVSQDYLDYQANYLDSAWYNKSFKEDIGIPKGLFSVISQGCTNGPNWPIVGFNFFMPPGYRNTVSSFIPSLIIGGDAVYDNLWFRQHLWTFGPWANGLRRDFCGAANPFRGLENRAESWIVFGI